MTEDFEDESGVYIALKLSTRVVRVLENTLIPSRLTIETDLNPTEEASEEDLQGAITKIKYFFDHIVSSCVAFSADNAEALEMFVDSEGCNRTSNLFMLTPGEPSDDLLATLFQSKMTALSAGSIDFGFVKVSSDNALGMSFTFIGEGTTMLPDNSQWIGERSYFDAPWWSRDDASTLDIMAGPDADLDDKPSWACSLDSLVQPKPDTGIVVRPEFRPTVIDGGKKIDE